MKQKQLTIDDSSFVLVLSDIKFKDHCKSKSMMYSPQIDGLVSDIFSVTMSTLTIMQELFQKIITKISNEYYDFINKYIESIRIIDIINTKINLIHEYNLCRPQIVKSENSFVDAKKLRHLLN